MQMRNHRTNRLRRSALATALALAAAGAFAADETGSGPMLEEVIVSSQRQSEDLQSVPISVQAIDGKRLEELHITDLDSITKYVPSLSIQTFGPSQAQIYFRGVTNGSDGLRVGSAPMVGVYLDEQPVTTIATSLDLHLYDMERIEALAGPQGTLFGASSMAGTLRYITNKPELNKNAAGYDVYARETAHGTLGEEIDGYANLALGERAAVRLVGFAERDSGYIDNVAGPYEVYPTSGVVRDNSGLRQKHYNPVSTAGGRAMLKLDLGGNWTVLPALYYQQQNARGSFAYEPSIGDLKVATYAPTINDDQWYQASLTITGKVWNLDLTYSGGYLRRTIQNVADYSDYSYAYDVAYESNPSYFGYLFENSAGQPINPAQTLVSYDLFAKRTHELRLASPASDRVHFVLGAFYQQQDNNDQYRYIVNGLAPSLSVDGQPGVHYENVVQINNVDRALFANVTAELTPKLKLELGGRLFDYRASSVGFFGFGLANGYYTQGEAQCTGPIVTTSPLYPCQNVDAHNHGGHYTDRGTLQYNVDTDRMLYATYSTGFRSGGFNRIPTVPGYNPDYLTNYELGWKTLWANHRVRFNGALFLENWKDAQFAVTGPYAITEVINAGGARTEGIESSLEWLMVPGWTLTGSGTYLFRHQLTADACSNATSAPNCGSPDNISAYSGTDMPVSARFKANLILRQEFSLGELKGWWQAAGSYQSSSRSTLDDGDEQVIGPTPGYGSMDANAGIEGHRWSVSVNVENLFDGRGQLGRYLICNSAYCTTPYVIPIKPRTISLQFGQKF